MVSASAVFGMYSRGVVDGDDEVGVGVLHGDEQSAYFSLGPGGDRPVSYGDGSVRPRERVAVRGMPVVAAT
jgi:hypothetical protein